MLSASKECRICRKNNITRANIPYCSKLLMQELMALGVSIKILTK